MDNQHKKIKGYRDLSQFEIDLMNEAKEHGEKTKELIDKLEQYRVAQLDSYENEELTIQQILESSRCLSIAKNELQTGQMWLVRAIALPTSF